MTRRQIDSDVLDLVEQAVRSAGAAVLMSYSTETRPTDRNDIGAMIAANDRVSINHLKSALEKAVPRSRVVGDEMETHALGAGDFWIVDPVEGAINQIHGMPDWGVTATLVRDNVPVLTAVYLPVLDQLYTASKSQGAWFNGVKMQVTTKTAMNGAMVGTGQAAPGESPEVLDLMGASVSAMLRSALTVRVSVPATLQLIQVAAGRMDGFWQFSPVLAGLVSGALLVQEAGGIVTDLSGQNWVPGAPDFLAAAPQFSAEMRTILNSLSK